MKHALLFFGFLVGVAAIVGGVIVAWNRFAPVFKVGSTNIVLATATPVQLAQLHVQKESGEIQTIITAFSNKYPNQFGIVATDLANGATAGVNADTKMVSASLYKIFVAWGIYKRIDAGTLKLSSSVAGLGESVGDCLADMIEVSDNDCGSGLGEMYGWRNLGNQLIAMGYKNTLLVNYDSFGNVSGDKTTTATDVAMFLTALYKGSLLSKGSTDAFISLLKQDKMNQWLPSGLPKGTTFAHKIGNLYDVVHDAGIVYAPKGDYLIVVMSRNWQNSNTQPPPAFADISRQLWNFFTS